MAAGCRRRAGGAARVLAMALVVMLALVVPAAAKGFRFKGVRCKAHTIRHDRVPPIAAYVSGVGCPVEALKLCEALLHRSWRPLFVLLGYAAAEAGRECRRRRSRKR
jgi:hypothetical protein